MLRPPGLTFVSMKQILLFGAGKSAGVLIDYLLQEAAAGNWQLVVIDADARAAEQKIGSFVFAKSRSFDVRDPNLREEAISQADLVISLLPPALHLLIARDCIQYKKNLLTASYVDEEMKLLRRDIEAAGLLFLCEMGLDPGIDHMSAKKTDRRNS